VARLTTTIPGVRSTERDGRAGGDLNTVLGRAFAILTSYRADDRSLTVTELTRRTGLPKPTVHRLVTQLLDWGALERTGTEVRLGMRLFELGQMAPRQRSLRDAALPLLGDLQTATQQTVHLAVLEGAEVVYVVKLPSRNGPEVPSRIGGRMPAYCTGVGKALLAHSPPAVLFAVVEAGLVRHTPRTVVMPGLLQRELADIRRTGVAFEREESARGIACVACPVLDERGSAVAAVSVTGWVMRMDVERMTSGVRTTALALSRSLGAHVGAPA
jgi:DNA-binding IclR family transcriptional regulator